MGQLNFTRIYCYYSLERFASISFSFKSNMNTNNEFLSLQLTKRHHRKLVIFEIYVKMLTHAYRTKSGY